MELPGDVLLLRTGRFCSNIIEKTLRMHGERNDMNVCFGENYWGCRETTVNRKPGREIRIESHFTLWSGKSWQIPAVYICEEGVVADFCGRVEPGEIAAFYERWRGREERLTEEEGARLEREHPFGRDFQIELWADGKKLPKGMGCGTSWCPADLRPWEEAKAAESDKAEELLLEAYDLDRMAGWSFWRQSFAWPKESLSHPESLVFTFVKEPVTVYGKHFRTDPKTAEKNVEFIHPATGKSHILTVFGQEPALLPLGKFPPGTDAERFPEHYAVLRYAVEPELSEEEELVISDCAQSDLPVGGEQAAARSVAVIGGASGPTSFFVAGKQPVCEEHPKTRCAYSSLHGTPVEAVEWKMVYRIRDGVKKMVRVEL